MSELSGLINTQVISSKYDEFWNDVLEAVKQLQPRPVLVITTPFAAGSAEETQLKKMMQACQLTEEDYNVIQHSSENAVAWHKLRDGLGVKSIVMLGVMPYELGVSAQFMPHQLSRFNDRNWIVTGTLEELTQRPEIKGHLWQYGLKPAFVDKVYG